MAYLDQEISTHDGKPFFLYEFNTLDTTFRVADCPEDIVFDSKIWNSLSIRHGNVTQGSEVSKNALDISVPLGSPFAVLFKGVPQDAVVTVTVFRSHYGASDSVVYWKGRVASHKLKSQELTVTCESIFTSLRRSGVRARFTKNCRHSVYSSGCGLDKDDWAVPGEIAGVDGLTVTVPEADAYTGGWFRGGVLELPDGSHAFISTHSGEYLTLLRQSRYIADNFVSGTPIPVTLYPGCDRTLETCKAKFDNILNNGGFRWIPTKNPMGGSSIV